MSHINVKTTFRYEGNIYEKVPGGYRLLTPCLEQYSDVTDKALIALLDKHTETWND